MMASSADTPLHEESLPDEGLGGPPLEESEGAEGLTQAGELPPGAEPVPGENARGVEFQLPGLDMRERALPVRQGDLTRLLIAEPGLTEEERTQLSQLGLLLGAMLHSEFYDQLRELKELYAPLDPDSDYVSLQRHSIPRTETSDESFLTRFDEALARANYRPLPLNVIEQAVTAPNEMGLTYQPDFSLFEHVKVYVQGYTRITRECRNLTTRFRRRMVTFDAYQRMVLALKFKGDKDLGPLVQSDVLYLRLFKDVPHVDMEMHLPEQGTRVQMRMIDKAQIASPLFTGIPAVIAKTLMAASFSWVLLGGLLVAPLTAGVRSYLGFQSSKRKHLYSMIHRLYYLTIANNASVLTRIIDIAEDEEYKEAMLAYFFLWRTTAATERLNSDSLDELIERFLRERTGVSINFEVADAVHKLFRLGLAHKDQQGRLYAIPLTQALRALDRRWDATYRFP
ncbi:MAG: DUF3754 domain-containing protein [Isosphaeraceae bacterium]